MAHDSTVHVASARGASIDTLILDEDTGSLRHIDCVEHQGTLFALRLAPKNLAHSYAGLVASNLEGELHFYALAGEQRVPKRVHTAQLPGPAVDFAFDPEGKWLAAALFFSDQVGVVPLEENGVADAFEVFDVSPKPHAIRRDPRTTLYSVPCRDGHVVEHLKVVKKEGSLSIQAQAKTPVLSDENVLLRDPGPRHLVFHPRKPFAYLLNENTVSMCVLQTQTAPEPWRLLSCQPLIPFQSDARAPEYSGAHLEITPDGKFLIASVRGADRISLFRISQDGSQCEWVQSLATEAMPRCFTLSSSHRFLLVAGEQSNHLAVYELDERQGAIHLRSRHPTSAEPVWVSVGGP